MQVRPPALGVKVGKHDSAAATVSRRKSRILSNSGGASTRNSTASVCRYTLAASRASAIVGTGCAVLPRGHTLIRALVGPASCDGRWSRPASTRCAPLAS